MPFSRRAGATLLAAALFMAAFAAGAKSLRDTGGPAEVPPAGFSGRQYVDSQGCVFLRAGYDGRVQWIPRVGQDGAVFCGQRPSLGDAAVAQTAAEPAAATAVPASPLTAAAPAPVVAAPGTALATTAAAEPRAGVPTGYRPAWKDGRLNPQRGLHAGSAAQAAPGATPAVKATPGPAPTPVAAAAGGRSVQVGVFADPANARRVIARLQALGLPVSQQPVRSRGMAATSVAAGPLSPGDQGRALSAVRRAGFADAFLR